MRLAASSSASASAIRSVSHSAGVLLGERHVVAGGAAPGAAPRFGVEHQREQPERLGLVRHQRHHEPPEPDRLLAEIAAARFGAGGIGPAFGEGGVDRLQHRVEPLAQIGCARAPGTECRPD